MAQRNTRLSRDLISHGHEGGGLRAAFARTGDVIGATWGEIAGSDGDSVHKPNLAANEEHHPDCARPMPSCV
jgi:hypothetical protein